jgi:hypothetical protein
MWDRKPGPTRDGVGKQSALRGHGGGEIRYSVVKGQGAMLRRLCRLRFGSLGNGRGRLTIVRVKRALFRAYRPDHVQ